MTPAITESAAVAPKIEAEIGMPNSVVEGTVLVTVDLNPLALFLSGGNLATDGWVASGNTITLSPLPDSALPALYQLSFQLPESFRLVGKGLQISGSAGEAFVAACVMNSPLELVNNVATQSESVTLNLGMILESTGNPPMTLNFGDPTIVFDPPQT